MKRLLGREEAAASEAFFQAYIRKNSRAYITAASVVLALECAMIVRGIFVFDFAKTRHVLYFLSYLFLGAATLGGLICVLRNRAGHMSPGGITLVLHLYCTVIIAWSMLVSYLDVAVGNSPIVYMTVIMSVGGLAVLNPVYYAVNLLLSFGLMLTVGITGHLTYFYESGSIVNLLIFALISLLLSFRQYRVSRREMELSLHLEDLSYRDQLTGIFNRRMYDEELRRIEGEDAAALLGLFDLDAFKGINDSYGHEFGDLCLQEAAKGLLKAYGERAYRIGGDEFAVLCGERDRAGLEESFREINEGLEAAFPGRSISLSGGFAARRAGSAVRTETVIEDADRALYASKRGGRRRLSFAEDPGAETGAAMNANE